MSRDRNPLRDWQLDRLSLRTVGRDLQNLEAEAMMEREGATPPGGSGAA